MIKVKNTKEMCLLLEVLEIQNCNMSDNSEYITLNIELPELAYALNASDESIQSIYGEGEAWKTLNNLLWNK